MATEEMHPENPNAPSQAAEAVLQAGCGRLPFGLRHPIVGGVLAGLAPWLKLRMRYRIRTQFNRCMKGSDVGLATAATIPRETRGRLAAAWCAAWCAGAIALLAGHPPPLHARAADLPAGGVVTRVSDGDTLWIRPDALPGDRPAKPFKLRLQGIDAPERCQAWGPQAQAALAARVLHQRVELQSRGASDDYGRALGNVLLAGEDVSGWMVSQGHAWSYRYRRSPGPYAAQEQAARQSGKGLFADPRAIEPREFRKAHGPCTD